MQAKIIKLDPEIDLPHYATAESAGFDIAAAENAVIQPGKLVLVKTGLIIQAPMGHFLLLASRGSLPIKKGLMIANGIGVIDRDFAGPTDEIMVELFNFSPNQVEIKKGERIAQGLFLPVDQIQWVPVEKIEEQSRGGFGHSGGYQK